MLKGLQDAFTTEPIERPEDHQIKAAPRGVREKLPESGPVGRGA